MGRGGRDIIDPLGDIILSRGTSKAREDRLLMAMLGVYEVPPYILPPNTLVLRE